MHLHESKRSGLRFFRGCLVAVLVELTAIGIVLAALLRP
jgi:hypothetical protein